MSPAQKRAAKLFARCFTPEELASLRLNPEFDHATQNIETTADALHAVEVGKRLTREAWFKLNYPDGVSQKS